MSYQRHDRNVHQSQRHNFSYWFPLVLTMSTAAIGAAAWVWSERIDGDESPPSSPDGSLHTPSRKNSNNYDHLQSPKNSGNESSAPRQNSMESPSYMARMSGALRRTPSPLQILDGASRSIVEGITAAGAVVGSALGSIIEEDKNAYKDHKTWSEEADARAQSRDIDFSLSVTANEPGNILRNLTEPKFPTKKQKKTVAIVISADSYDKDVQGDEEFQGKTVSMYSGV